jgi:uncharacterized cupredoxin-like copper-binding protein
MQRFAEWLQDALMRPRATAALISCLTGLALITSALSYAVNGPPASAIQGGAQSTQIANVAVTLSDYRIESSQTTFAPGMRYHFTIVNKGMMSHELMIMPQGMSQAPMEQMDHMALARTGDLAPSATKTFDFTFTSMMTQQHLEFGCYYPGHYQSGMHMPIVVGA